MEVLAEAVCARPRLTALELVECRLTPEALPPLVRALQHGSLTALELVGTDLEPLLLADGGAPALSRALRECRTLTTLRVAELEYYGLSAAAVAAILGALVGHRSLAKLELSSSMLRDHMATGAALARLLRANAPALTELSLDETQFVEEGLGLVYDALRRNRHLCTLNVRGNHRMNRGFFRNRLLPAVRANTSLRTLIVMYEPHVYDDSDDDDWAAGWEAEAIVAARR